MEQSAKVGTAEMIGHLKTLHKDRSKNVFVRLSLITMVLLIGYSWSLGDLLNLSNSFTTRGENIERFFGELQPYELRGESFSMHSYLSWSKAILAEKGSQALQVTLAISVAAIVLSGISGNLLAIPAARNFMSGFNRSQSHLGGMFLAGAIRLLLIFLRAIPEYVWAFLFISLLGPSAWPLVLALALHNCGIIGKLSAEVIEDLPEEPQTSLSSIGASRLQIMLAAVLPVVLPRCLLFFFYRWETCVREATVLGMLGIVSLGFWIQDARARNFYDEMVFFILLGAFLVIIGDMVSTLVRAYVRRIS